MILSKYLYPKYFNGVFIMLLTTINDNKVKKKKKFDFRRVEHFCGDSSRIIAKKVNLEPCCQQMSQKKFIRIIQTTFS